MGAEPPSRPEPGARCDRVRAAIASALRQGGDLVEAEERRDIEGAVAALRAARDGDDRALIQARTTALNVATEHLAEVLMEAAAQGALGTGRATELLGDGRA